MLLYMYFIFIQSKKYIEPSDLSSSEESSNEDYYYNLAPLLIHNDINDIDEPLSYNNFIQYYNKY